MRYADVLLILAEAENEVNGGPTSLAYEEINEVKERASLDPPEGLNQDTMSYKHFMILLLLAAGIETSAQDSNTKATTGTVKLIDPEATRKTRALYLNLQDLSHKGVLFGHQDDLAYGVNWKNQDGRSDVKDVRCGFFFEHTSDISLIRTLQ